jgi:hypothetical protein
LSAASAALGMKDHSLEARRRMERLVDALEYHRLPAAVRHTQRSVQVLETIATPAARALLKKLATGAAGARQTREAREALERLEQRNLGAWK